MNHRVPAKIRFLVLFVVGILLFTACAYQGAGPANPLQVPKATGDGWQTISLKDAGIDPGSLAAMLEDIQDGGFDNLYSLLIVKDGKLAFEQYFHGHNENTVDYVASVTKSVTSLLVGIAIQQGLIAGPDQTLPELLPAYADVISADPLKQKLQLRHILTMTTGIEWDEDSYPYGSALNDATRMERSPDGVQFILDRPIIRQPGEQFQYSAANSMLLSAILEQATGMSAADFAKKNLFDPLGISSYRWDTYADGRTHTDGGLHLRPRDMAKIGQLMLNGGQWNGIQIVSPQWVAESTRAHTYVSPGTWYGYQWWRDSQSVYLENTPSYFAAGFGGQLISVYPDQNMIVVVTGEVANHDENTFRFMLLRSKYLLPATNPAVFSKVFLWGWAVLTAAGLAFLVRDIAKRQISGIGWSICWLLIGAVFGPLGLAVYLLAYRNLPAVRAVGWKALGMAVFSAVGNVTGLVLLVLLQMLFLQDNSLILLVIPVSFQVSWLFFFAPLAASTSSISYWRAAWRTLLTALVSACFVLAGLFPVLILLTIRWFLPGVDLANPLFWVMMVTCGIAGALACYPFSLWLAYRRLDYWPAPPAPGGETEAAGKDRRLPAVRDAWAALLLGLVVLIAVFSFIMMSLS